MGVLAMDTLMAMVFPVMGIPFRIMGILLLAMGILFRIMGILFLAMGIPFPVMGILFLMDMPLLIIQAMGTKALGIIEWNIMLMYSMIALNLINRIIHF